MAVLNEADNILPVCQELAGVLDGFPENTEILAIDDGSTDATVEKLLEARRQYLPNLRILSHPRRLGKSAALRTGATAAHGEWMATIDGDGQDDPSSIIRMLELARSANSKPPLVVGVRRKRNDRLSRRIATKLANGLRRRLLNDVARTPGRLSSFSLVRCSCVFRSLRVYTAFYRPSLASMALR